MAFPTYTRSVYSEFQATVHSVTIPSGSVDDLMILFSRPGGGANRDSVADAESEWTQSTGNTGVFWWKRATGNEGGTLTVTLSGDARLTAIVTRVTGSDPAEDPVFVRAGGSSSPLVTAPWGSRDNLFLAGLETSASNQTVTAPTGYGDTATSGSASSSATSRVRIWQATRNLAAASDTPGAWTLDSGTLYNELGTSVVIAGAASAAFSDTVAWTEQDDTAAATGTTTPPVVTATGAWTEQPDGITATGAFTHPPVGGVLAWTEADDTVAASGTHTAPTVSGDVTYTEQADTAAATGAHVPPTSTGGAAWTEQDDTAAATGTTTPPPFTGTVIWAEGDDGWAATGTAVPPAFTGVLAWTEEDDGWAVGHDTPVPGPTFVTASQDPARAITSNYTVSLDYHETETQAAYAGSPTRIRSKVQQ